MQPNLYIGGLQNVHIGGIREASYFEYSSVHYGDINFTWLFKFRMFIATSKGNISSKKFLIKNNCNTDKKIKKWLQ